MKIYACLLGEWVNLTDSGAKIMQSLNDFVDPNIWYKESGVFNVNRILPTENLDNYEKVKILYKNQVYSIHPSFIQTLE